MIDSLIIAVTFISIIPIPQRYIPVWSSHTLRYFCPMLAVTGGIFALWWLVVWAVLCELQGVSALLRGFLMTILTLGLTGGLHLDGLMDTCDAIFSHRDMQTRLEILSDTHAGSFAVMGCVVILLGETLLFSELLTLEVSQYELLFVPVYSRLWMAVLLNNMPFAKTGGLAVMLGSARSRKHNVFFAGMLVLLSVFTGKTVCISCVICFVLWSIVCMRLFGGITGDLLGAGVNFSEVFMLIGLVISECI